MEDYELKGSATFGGYVEPTPWVVPHEWRCRHCDPVERINALAERYTSKWVLHTYIKCADIIMESE